MPVKDGPACPGCGLPNYEGLCPHCRGDAEAYEHELVPPFPSLREEEEEKARARAQYAEDEQMAEADMAAGYETLS